MTASARASVLERPWHTLTAALVAGLAFGPRAPIAVLGAALALPLLMPTGPWLLAALAALSGGAVLAGARLAALDHAPPLSHVGHVLTVEVTLLDTPRQ